jgi:imidazolonepropionase-like amidohydrolase
MISGAGSRKLFEDEPQTQERSALQAVSRLDSGAGARAADAADSRFEGGGSGKMVLDAMKAGALVVAGTDTPNAINLHGELMAYTLAGMSNFDALKAATVNPARALARRHRHDRSGQARRSHRRRRRSARADGRPAQDQESRRERPALRTESW